MQAFAFKSWESAPGSSIFEVSLTLAHSGSGEVTVDIIAHAQESKSFLRVTGLELVTVTSDVSLGAARLAPVITLSELEGHHDEQPLPLRACRRIDTADQVRYASPESDQIAYFVPHSLSSLAQVAQGWADRGRGAHLWVSCSSESALCAPALAIVQTFRLEHPEANIGLLSHEDHDFERNIVPLLSRLPIDLGVAIHVDADKSLRLPVQKPISALPPARSTPLSPSWIRGTFVITGGTGGLGLAAAEALLDAGVGHVALLSRTGQATTNSDDRLRRLLQLENGRRASIHLADVTNRQEVVRALGHVESRFGAIVGVLHAAGELSSGYVPSKGFSEAVFDGHHAVKVNGLLSILSALHGNNDLQVVVGFSSTSATVGLRQQAEYAAANAAMDQTILQYAQNPPRDPRQQTRYISVHIDAVASVGFAAGHLKNSSQEGLMRIDEFQRLIVHIARDAPSGAIDLLGGNRAALWLSRQGVRTSATTSHELPAPSQAARNRTDDPKPRARPAQTDEQSDHIREVIHSTFEEVTGTPLAGDSTPFMDAGLDSLTSVSFRHVLEDKLHISLPTSLAFDYPNRVLLGRFLREQAQRTREPDAVDANAKPLTISRIDRRDPIQKVVVAAMDCVFPGADGVEAFWDKMMSGQDMCHPISTDRLDIEGYNASQGSKAITIKEASMLGYDQIFSFDHDFFGMSRREAEATDPAQRLVLRTCFQALHRAGYTRDELQGSRTGVFVGTGPSGWTNALGFKNALTGAGSATSLLANRVSYVFGLVGPSMVVDTACSSSLVALHLAKQSLQGGECDIAVVCGVQVHLDPATFEQVSRSQMVSPSDNRSKPFDARADGYGRGEGCGALVLLSAAEAARRSLGSPLAILGGTAVNQDGRSASLTAPNGPSQEAVIRQALEDAQLGPADVSYIETHGTGTKLGDPIEFNALRNVFGTNEEGQRPLPLALGALKGQIGHLEAAAGIASLIKVILVFNHGGLLPKNVNYQTLNPEILPGSFNFVLPQAPIRLSQYQGTGSGRPTIHAGISSFGFGGTNGHVVLSSAPTDTVDNGQLSHQGEDGRDTQRELSQGYGEVHVPNGTMRPPYRYASTLVEPPVDAKCSRREQYSLSKKIVGSSGPKRMTFQISSSGVKVVSRK
ncbi:thiolase-like protein [Diaporthe sp. PMI_573]|nr:thiolase-like protein [Diaporthaceae sp. PMI_573]